jgi:hypothetical protein
VLVVPHGSRSPELASETFEAGNGEWLFRPLMLSLKESRGPLPRLPRGSVFRTRRGSVSSAANRTMIRKRCRRFDEPGHALSLTFSCDRRLPLLSRDRTRLWLIESIEEARRLTGFDLWAFVIMPEHLHLLLYPQSQSIGISQILWRIKQPVGRKAIA